MEQKQTAVEWLVDELLDGKLLMPSLIEQAKEMEKQQIIDANEDASTNELGEFLTGKQYYNKEYGNET